MTFLWSMNPIYFGAPNCQVGRLLTNLAHFHIVFGTYIAINCSSWRLSCSLFLWIEYYLIFPTTVFNYLIVSVIHLLQLVLQTLSSCHGQPCLTNEREVGLVAFLLSAAIELYHTYATTATGCHWYVLRYQYRTPYGTITRLLAL